ncbi:hypothetical protein CPC08DRAFT_770702 [Agrocybe pediades]|nr:hypothetical protein CPC08DRAFT_770702 [Agrocybe pediades]
MQREVSASGLSNSTVVDKSLNCSEESKLCLTYITACLDRQLRALLKWPHHALIKPMWSKAVVISQLMRRNVFASFASLASLQRRQRRQRRIGRFADASEAGAGTTGSYDSFPATPLTFPGEYSSPLSKLPSFGRRVKQKVKLSGPAEADFDTYCSTADRDERQVLHYALNLQVRDLLLDMRKPSNWSVTKDLK